MPAAHAVIEPAMGVTSAVFAAHMDALGPFESEPVIAVAVSGGIDSMCLAMLAQDWASTRDGRAIALTVDHGLRSESAAEAQHVANLCKALGIEHHLLRWQPPALTHAIQQQARDARYGLLTSWCQQQHVLHLLTAHHQGDQAETLFFRLARGSGLDGLASMPAISYHANMRLLRPLLAFSKQQLLETLAARKLEWVEDPSNRSLNYTRNSIRAQLQAVQQPERLRAEAAELTQRLGIIRHHLETGLASQLAKAVSVFPGGYATVDTSAFLSLAPEYALRLLTDLMQTLGGDSYRLRSEKIARLYQDMCAVGSFTRRTLGGLVLVWQERSNSFLFCREPKAAGASLTLTPGLPQLWDQRFQVSHTSKNPLRVAALGTKGARIIKDLNHKAALSVPKSALICFPAFWRLEELVAVPHIDYHHLDYAAAQCHARFMPAKALAATAFSGMNILPNSPLF